MASRQFGAPRHSVEPHDHAVVVYSDEADLIRALAHFLEDGIARNDLMVFVHAYEDEAEAWDLLDRARPGARRLSESRLVVINYYREAFERDGRIDYPHVGGIVSSLEQAARETGRVGVRVFVDASRVYFGSARTEEWFGFEEWLGRRLRSAMGLVCAYPREKVMAPNILARVLRTHSYRFAPPA